VAVLAVGCDLGSDQEMADATDGADEEGSGGECEEGDDDGDGICNADDLCDEAAGTHCLEIGTEMPAIMSQYTLDGSGRFADLMEADLRAGITLEIDGLETVGGCDAELGMPAREYSALVISANLRSSVPEAQKILDEANAEFQAEVLRTAIKFVAGGEDADPQFQAGFASTLPPGHLMALIDGFSYQPRCADADVGSTITGSTGLFRLEHGTVEAGVTDRVQASGATFSFHPVGG
jgi:hypothetical protein